MARSGAWFCSGLVLKSRAGKPSRLQKKNKTSLFLWHFRRGKHKHAKKRERALNST